MNPENYDSHLKLEIVKKRFETETNKTFASVNDLMTEKTINGSPVIVLDNNVNCIT